MATYSDNRAAFIFKHDYHYFYCIIIIIIIVYKINFERKLYYRSVRWSGGRQGGPSPQ